MIPANGVTRDTNVFRSFQREPGKEKMSEIGVGQRWNSFNNACRNKSFVVPANSRITNPKMLTVYRIRQMVSFTELKTELKKKNSKQN